MSTSRFTEDLRDFLPEQPSVCQESVQFPSVIDVFLRETPIYYSEVGSRVLQPQKAAGEFTVE